MPKFRSIKGVWFPEDQQTKAELEQIGIDHLGIHTSEDPYLKQMEYVTGIPRHELMQGQQRHAMERMMDQMQQNQMVMTMLLAGDKDGALSMLKGIQDKAVEKQKESDERAKKDPIELAREEFDAVMNPEKSGFKTIPDKPKELQDIPAVKEDPVIVHDEVKNKSAIGMGVSSGLVNPGQANKNRELKAK